MPEGKAALFKKSAQKFLSLVPLPLSQPAAQLNKSFLLLFFKKEAFLPS
jgi:hypothetical protein